MFADINMTQLMYCILVSCVVNGVVNEHTRTLSGIKSPRVDISTNVGVSMVSLTPRVTSCNRNQPCTPPQSTRGHNQIIFYDFRDYFPWENVKIQKVKIFTSYCPFKLKSG